VERDRSGATRWKSRAYNIHKRKRKDTEKKKRRYDGPLEGTRLSSGKTGKPDPSQKKYDRENEPLILKHGPTDGKKAGY